MWPDRGPSLLCWIIRFYNTALGILNDIKSGTGVCVLMWMNVNGKVMNKPPTVFSCLIMDNMGQSIYSSWILRSVDLKYENVRQQYPAYLDFFHPPQKRWISSQINLVKNTTLEETPSNFLNPFSHNGNNDITAPLQSYISDPLSHIYHNSDFSI